MSLCTRERRSLWGIQDALDRSDPRLASLFTIFFRLTQEEEMPDNEQLRVRVDRLTARGRHIKMAALSRLRVIMIAPVALAVTVTALLIGGWSGSPAACKAAPAASNTRSWQGRSWPVRSWPVRSWPGRSWQDRSQPGRTTTSARLWPAVCQMPWRPAMAAR
jgi:hypothetical protein